MSNTESAEAESPTPQGWEPIPQYQIESLIQQMATQQARHAEEVSRLEAYIRQQDATVGSAVTRINELEAQLKNREARRTKPNSPSTNGKSHKKVKRK